MGIFERYLSLWVGLSIVASVVLATEVGALVEVPVMLSLVYIVNRTHRWLGEA